MFIDGNKAKYFSSAKPRTTPRTTKLMRGEMLAMRKELHNLVRVLKAQGVQINESEVFVD